MDLKLSLVTIEKPEPINFILGQSHFIKTVEDLYEIIATTVPQARFGIAFSEASDPCLIRSEGNDDSLIKGGVTVLKAIGAGHVFCILLRDAYPINVLNQVKNCPEVCRIYCATANPTEVILAETEQGRGILGVVDGNRPVGVEDEEDIAWRKGFLRMIGYKS